MGFVINKDKLKEENNDFVLPEGEYKVYVEKAWEKLTKNDEEMMSLMCRIIGPRFANGIIWVNIVYNWAWAASMFEKIFEDLPNEVTVENVINQKFWVKKTDESDFVKIEPRKKERKAMDPEDEDYIPF